MGIKIGLTDKVTGKFYSINENNNGLDQRAKDRAALGCLFKKRKYKTINRSLKKQSRFSLMMGFNLAKIINKYSITVPESCKLKEQQIKGRIKNILIDLVILKKMPIPKDIIKHVVETLVRPASEGYTVVKSITLPNIVTLQKKNNANDIYALNLWKECKE